MPPITGTTQMPTGGSAYTYGQIPYTAGDPSRLAPAPGTSLPFINRPPIDITVRGGAPTQTASIPLPRPRPGMNIQPWAQAENLMDPGNPGYVDPNASPVMSAYAPQPAPAPQAPAAAAASTMAQGQAPQTSWMQDMITGLNSLMPGYNSPRDMSRAEMYDATNAAAATAAQTRDRSGFGTDGYVRNASGQVIGRDGQYSGMSSSQMYDQLSGRQTDDSWKTTFSESRDPFDSLPREERAAARAAARQQPVTLGPTQAPSYSLASAMTRTGKKGR